MLRVVLGVNYFVVNLQIERIYSLVLRIHKNIFLDVNF